MFTVETNTSTKSEETNVGKHPNNADWEELLQKLHDHRSRPQPRHLKLFRQPSLHYVQDTVLHAVGLRSNAIDDAAAGPDSVSPTDHPHSMTAPKTARQDYHFPSQCQSHQQSCNKSEDLGASTTDPQKSVNIPSSTKETAASAVDRHCHQYSSCELYLVCLWTSPLIPSSTKRKPALRVSAARNQRFATSHKLCRTKLSSRDIVPEGH